MDPRYKFDLPSELIARYPAPSRDSSRLLLLDPQGARLEEFSPFGKILSLINSNDLLIFNEAKVSKMRLIGKRATGGKVEALILEETERGMIALIRPLTRLKIGEEIAFAEIAGRLIEILPGGKVLLDFGGRSLEEVTESVGEMPIPPYLKRRAESIDDERYQTVVARTPGSAAAPTAGLHFTPQIIAALETNGVTITRLHLNVGYGTFAPVTGDEERLHSERYAIPREVIEAIARTKSNHGRVIAVGTTTTRALESYARAKCETGDTDIFIKSGDSFMIVDAMITNFHLPESSLLMLVHAFAGDSIFDAYRHAIDEKFRFFSYGDAMFIANSASKSGAR